LSDREEYKIPTWARDNMSLAHAGILNSSMLKTSEEGLTLSLTGSWPASVSLSDRASASEKRATFWPYPIS